MKKTIYLIITIFLINIALAQVEVRHIGICNGNEICENKENHQNCPQDCLSGQKDGYCDGIPDNICDIDCPSQSDPDCEPKISLWQKIVYSIKKPFIDIKSLRPTMQKAYYIIITGSAIIIIAIIILLIILALKIDKYRREKLIQEIKGLKMPTTTPPKIKELLKPEKKPIKKIKPKIKPKKEVKKIAKKKKVVKKKPTKPKEIKLSPKMQEYYDLLEKPVKRLLAAGYTKKEIKTQLIEKRWPREVLNTLFKKL